MKTKTFWKLMDKFCHFSWLAAPLKNALHYSKYISFHGVLRNVIVEEFCGNLFSIPSGRCHLVRASSGILICGQKQRRKPCWRKILWDHYKKNSVGKEIETSLRKFSWKELLWNILRKIQLGKKNLFEGNASFKYFACIEGVTKYKV